MVGGKVEKVELHPKGFINIFFTSLKHLEEKEKEEQKIVSSEEEETQEEVKKVAKDGQTNLQEYFEEMIPLGASDGLAHSYEVRVELAVFTEEKFKLYSNYFQNVHGREDPQPASF